ncbi:MAG: IS3 family transposase [Clostridia bacterium]|nr:IS3 family transposase [Clostridia bacterium]
MQKHTHEEKENAVSLYQNGTPVSQLSAESGIPRSTIYRWIQASRAETEKKEKFTLLQFQRLEQRNAKLERIVAILQHSDCKPTDPLSDRLRTMDELYGQYSVHTLCDAFCVPRGTYYNHIYRRKTSDSWYEIRREEFRERIQKIYDDSNQILGYKKICAVLKDQGFSVSANFVRGLMEDMGLVSIRQGSKSYYEKEQRKYINHVNRQFNPQKPNEIWVGDVTYFQMKERHYYICVILDLFSRRVIAYKIGKRNSTNLTKSTFKSAYENRRPEGALIFHSDRGANYRSKAFCDYLRKLQVTQSFSKSHTPFDNSVVESFFANLKREELYRTKYRSEREFRAAVDRYVLFYNEKRPHTSNGNKTPQKREQEYMQNQV